MAALLLLFVPVEIKSMGLVERIGRPGKPAWESQSGVPRSSVRTQDSEHRVTLGQAAGQKYDTRTIESPSTVVESTYVPPGQHRSSMASPQPRVGDPPVSLSDDLSSLSLLGRWTILSLPGPQAGQAKARQATIKLQSAPDWETWNGPRVLHRPAIPST